MNRKAQLATALLVVVALGYSGVALYAMAGFNSDFAFQSGELSIMITQLEEFQNVVENRAIIFGQELVKACKDCSPEQLATAGEKFDRNQLTRSDKDGNFFAKLRNGEFTFTKSGENYKLEIKDLFIQTQRGYNVMKRPFEICKIFSPEGKYLGNC